MRFPSKLTCDRLVLTGAMILTLMITSGFTTDTLLYCSMKAANPGGEAVELKVAGAKLAVSDDVAVNVDAIKKAIDYARQEEADILLTPEGSLSGYTPDFNREEVEKALREVVAYASEARVGLALGTCFYEADDRCYNQIRFYDKQGEFLGFHSKVLRCGDHGDPKGGEINTYAAKPLRTFEFEGVLIGGLICNDMWANPACTTLPDTHLSQQLSHMGARIIFHAVNGGRDDSEWSQVNWDFHASNLRMRAGSGKIWIVSADNSHPENLNSSAPSGVLNTKGSWVCSTEAKGAQFFSYTIALEN